MLGFLLGLGFTMLVIDSLTTPTQRQAPFYRKGRKMLPQERAESMKRTMLLAQEMVTEVDPPVPLPLIAAIIHIESDFNPSVVNTSPNAMRRGGAWGLAQFTLKTAIDYANRFPDEGKKYWPQYDGQGETLKDPRTNLGFAIFYLSRALKSFDGDILKAGVSYHQGKAGVREAVLEKGENWVNALGPNGRRYHELLVQKLVRYQGKGAAVAGVGAVLQEAGTGAGGGGDCRMPDPPPVKEEA